MTEELKKKEAEIRRKIKTYGVKSLVVNGMYYKLNSEGELISRKNSEVLKELKAKK